MHNNTNNESLEQREVMEKENMKRIIRKMPKKIQFKCPPRGNCAMLLSEILVELRRKIYQGEYVA